MVKESYKKKYQDETKKTKILSEEIEDYNRTLICGTIILAIAVLIVCIFIGLYTNYVEADREQQQEITYLKDNAGFIDIATIININEQGCCVYVIYDNQIWELDYDDDIINIENVDIGDKAIFIFDYYETDADMLNFIKVGD